MAYQVNFCETKEQLKHLGEVVTGKVDGSPTGADIDTSTLAYTGQERETLPELLAKIGWYSVGEWSSDPLISNDNQYVVYDGDRYVPLSVPYQVNSTANPDPEVLVGTELKVITDVTDEDITTAQNDIVGGSIFKGSNGDTVEVGDVVEPGTTHLRVSGGDFSEITLLAVVRKDGGPLISGNLSSIQLTPPYQATIGTDDVWLIEDKHYNPDKVYANGFGIQNTATDGACLQAAADLAIALGRNAVYLQEGTELRNETTVNMMDNTVLGMALIAEGEGATIYNIGGAGIRFTRSDYFEETLTTDANFKDDFFISTDPSEYVIGSVVHISSDQVPDLSFGYEAQGLYIVTHKSGNTIYLDRRLRFNFLVSDNAKVRRNVDQSWCGIKGINTEQIGPGTGALAIGASNLNKMYIVNCSSNYDGLGTGTEDGFGASETAFITVDDFKGKRLRYPLIFRCCFDINIRKLHGDEFRPPRHFADFNLFTERAVIDGFSGVSREGGVNSHSAFDINYKNGSTVDTTAISNNRWLGGGMQHVKIVATETAGASGMLSGFDVDTGLYPNYYDDLEDLGLFAHFEDVQIDDTKRAAASFTGRGFSIGMPGYYNNIRNVQPVDGSFTVAHYIYERPMNLTFGDMTPPLMSNKSGLDLGVRLVNNQPNDAVQDSVIPTRYNANVDSTNVIREKIDGTTSARIKVHGTIVPYTVVNPSNITFSFLFGNHTFGRANNQRFRITFKLTTWNGIAEKTVNIYNQSNTRTAVVNGEFPVQQSSASFDITINSVVGDPSFINTETVPVLFDLSMSVLDANRPWQLTYEAEGYESGN